MASAAAMGSHEGPHHICWHPWRSHTPSGPFSSLLFVIPHLCPFLSLLPFPQALAPSTFPCISNLPSYSAFFFFSSCALAFNTLQSETGAKRTHRLLAHPSSSSSSFPLPRPVAAPFLARPFTVGLSHLHLPSNHPGCGYSKPLSTFSQTQLPGLPRKLSLHSFLNKYFFNRLLGELFYPKSHNLQSSLNTPLCLHGLPSLPLSKRQSLGIFDVSTPIDDISQKKNTKLNRKKCTQTI